MIDFRSTAPAAGAIRSLQFTEPKPEPVSTTRLYVCAPRQNDVIQLNLYWPTGTAVQQSRYQARTALSLSLNGTAEHTAEQIQEQFDYWGTQLNPDTSLLYSELLLRSTAEYFEDSLQWLISNYSKAIFPVDEIENYKQMEVAALQRKTTTPRYWAHRLGMESVYGTDDVNTRFAEPEHILGLRREDIQSFHGKMLNLKNAIWILSGDTNDKVRDRAKTIIGGLDGAVQSSERIREHKPNPVASIRRKVENTSQVSLFMARPMPVIGEVDYHRYAMMNLMLGGFFGSRLMQEIREERGLTYGIGSYIQQTGQSNLWCISGEMNADNANAALDAVHEILRGLVTNPPKGEELDRAKRYYSGQLRSSFDGPFSMPSKIRGLLNRGYDFSHYATAMDTIWSVNTEELCQMADNYLNPESFHTVLAGNTGV